MRPILLLACLTATSFAAKPAKLPADSSLTPQAIPSNADNSAGVIGEVVSAVQGKRPDDDSHWQKAYPAATAGMKRIVIHLDAQADEYAWKIELSVGKVMETDGVNHIGGGAKIAEKTVDGWGYSYFEAKADGPMATTLIGVPPGTPKVTRFVTMAGTGPVRYNSRLPLVVYVSEGLEVRYRLWKAEPETRKGEAG
jgi:ecotin